MTIFTAIVYTSLDILISVLLSSCILELVLMLLIVALFLNSILL